MLDRPVELEILEEELNSRGFNTKRDDWPRHFVVVVKGGMYSIFYGGRYFDIMRLTREGEPDTRFQERREESYQGIISLLLSLR